MRLLVCGDRNWTDKELVKKILAQVSFDVLIEGEARGTDRISREVVKEGQLSCSVLPFHADWDTYHKAAGPIRNRQMIKEGKPDLILAFHNHIEESKGTADMLCIAEDKDIPYCLIEEEIDIVSI